DQIDQDIAAGVSRQDAIIGAAVRRFRPIALTAMTAVLALIPISRGVFWGPLAYAMMGGILVATLLTVFALPAGYALFFGREPKRAHAPEAEREPKPRQEELPLAAE
ncbi:MAG: efflux RND transporter permease subunit, partial [Rhizobiaceae bacterium]|nr:efflux RND transporter permease subunit [Rhizobiaceae bacterium]